MRPTILDPLKQLVTWSTLRALSAGLVGCALCGALTCSVLPEYGDPPNARGSNCHPSRVGLRAAGAFSWDGGHDPECSVDESGRLLMKYVAEAGCPATTPWRSCLVAEHQDFSEFARKHGVYEAVVCVDGPLPGALELKIEYAPDSHGARQQQHTLRMIQQWERAASGCTRATFRADDLSFPGQCAERSPETLQCRTAGTEGESETNPTPAIDPEDPTISDAQFLLTTEACSEEKAPSEPTPVTLVLSHLDYYPSECFCSESTECAPDHYCDRDGWLDLSCCRCQKGCPGLCRSND